MSWPIRVDWTFLEWGLKETGAFTQRVLQLKTVSLECVFCPVWKHNKKATLLGLNPTAVTRPFTTAKRHAHLSPSQTLLLMYCLIAGPWCSPEPPPALPYTTCHSAADSFIYFLTIPVLLSLSGYTATFPCSFSYFHLYLLCRFPPSQIPLTHYLRFSLSLLYHSSREHLIIPYQLFLFSLPSLIPPNLPSFCRLSASPPAICQPFAFLFIYLFFISLTPIKPRIVSLSGNANTKTLRRCCWVHVAH